MTQVIPVASGLVRGVPYEGNIKKEGKFLYIAIASM